MCPKNPMYPLVLNVLSPLHLSCAKKKLPQTERCSISSWVRRQQKRTDEIYEKISVGNNTHVMNCLERSRKANLTWRINHTAVDHNNLEALLNNDPNNSIIIEIV